MKIALIHFRAGETDGVSLEMSKWKKCILAMGHECWLVAGCGGDINAAIFEYRGKTIESFFSDAFAKRTISESQLEQQCHNLYREARQKLEEIWQQQKPDIVIVNNIFSLPLNLPLAMAIADVNRDWQIATIGFHHDFYWERDIYNPTCTFIEKLVLDYFPPKQCQKHLVINSIAQNSLLQRKKFSSAIVDNYFDFEEVLFELDAYNSQLRSEIGIDKSDIMVLHATRIVKRKGIEFALQICQKLQQDLKTHLGKTLFNGEMITSKTKLELVFPGLNEDNEYFMHIRGLADKYSVSCKFVPEKCLHQRAPGKFSLWDFYVATDLVTYTSLYEGWGNQLVEALAACKPVIVYEYPVFCADLSKLKLQLLSLGDMYVEKDGIKSITQEKIEEVAKHTWETLLSKEIYLKMVEHNYQIAKKHLSLEALTKKIRDVIEDIF